MEQRIAREPFDAIVAFARFAEQENLRWYVFGAQAVAIADLDHARVERTLAELESMLDQSDLRPVYTRLRAEQASRKVGAKPRLRASSRAAGAKRRGS